MTSSQSAGRARRHAAVIALACGVLHVALIIALFGVTSLLSESEVVSGPKVSLFVGPGMIAIAVLATTTMLLIRAPREADDGLDWGYSLLTGIVALASYVLASLVFGSVSLGMAEGLHFAWVTLLGGYDVIVGVLAAACALLYSFIIARRYDERGRPRWTWEDDFDA